jgi:hypothetical protein
LLKTDERPFRGQNTATLEQNIATSAPYTHHVQLVAHCRILANIIKGLEKADVTLTIDWVDIVALKIRVHDGEEHLKEQVYCIQKNREQEKPCFACTIISAGLTY